jgi:UDP-glucose 6-dehydrogenase
LIQPISRMLGRSARPCRIEVALSRLLSPRTSSLHDFGGVMNSAVFGLGYVGSVTSAGLATNGHDAWGADVDPAKVAPLAEGRSPVVEPGRDQLIARGAAAGTLHATTDIREALDEADISLICVGSPSTRDGGTDLSCLRNVTARSPRR